MREFDLVVIGGGPGGYVAAIRAAQLGLKTACVEGRDALGGTCLNVGCIPSKALLASSEHYAEVNGHLAAHGINVTGVTLDLGRMMARKDKVVTDLTKGIAFLFKKNGVEWLKGWGRIPEPGRVEVEGSEGNETVVARNIVVATGSEPTPLPGVEIDEDRIVSSTGALALREVPARLVVIGAGVIGLELGQVWARLGSKVTVVEYLDRILPGTDAEIAKLAQRTLARQGLAFQLGRRVTGCERGPGGLTLTMERRETGVAEALEADVVLVAIGRRPLTAGLGLDALGIVRDPRGFVAVDAAFRTAAAGIFAIGDCVAGPMLAHKAEEDGVACVEGIAGTNTAHVDYGCVPGVVYTAPEIASLGATEEELKEAGTPYVAGRFAFLGNGKARASGETDGLVKVLADPATGRLLGGHVLGAHAGDLIAELVLAKRTDASIADVAHASHAHPGLAEAVKEACLAALGQPLHA